MQDRTITNALVKLRAPIAREGGPGLEHVEALLQMRGHNLGPVPRKRPDNRFRKNELRRLIQDALRDGPQSLGGIAAHVAAQRPSVGPRVAYQRVSSVLSRMKAEGLVVHEGRVWRVPGPASSLTSPMVAGNPAVVLRNR